MTREQELDFAYLMGVFNTSGIDGLSNECKRLIELDRHPHEMFEKQPTLYSVPSVEEMWQALEDMGWDISQTINMDAILVDLHNWLTERAKG